jgi:pimeloyl-ACP methyl ester carboxylesterase
MAKPYLGTSSWARRNDGALTLGEQASFVVGALNNQAAEVGRDLLRLLRPAKSGAMLAQRSAPDSELAREAYELAAESYSSNLLGHCLRSWWLADLFAQRDDITYDAELLYVSSLLHDLALTGEPTGHCFAVDGGRSARDRVLLWGGAEQTAERVEEAIMLHMNIHVPLRFGAEAYLLHAATHLDVAGTRMRDIPIEQLREVVARYPRDGFAGEFGSLMRSQAAAAPRSRAALAWRSGLAIPLRHNRLDTVSKSVPAIGPDEPVGRPVRLPTGQTAVEMVPQSGTVSATPVLLVHGMMGGAWQFSWFQRSLARAGYRSLAVNYRGHHDSLPTEALGRVGVGDYLQDALDACAYLRTPPIVVGQSMGGLITQLLAARGFAHAAMLVCSLPPAGIRWDGARNPRFALRHLPAVLARRPIPPHRAELDDLIFNRIPVEQRHAYFARQVPESSRAATQIAYGRVAVDADQVSCPVLSVSAGHDRLVYPEIGEAIAQRYHGDHLSVEQAGHYALVGEPGWEHLAEQIIEWVAAHSLDSQKR